VAQDLTWRGKLFHKQGAATEKALSPNEFSRDFGVVNKNLCTDLKGLEDVC